MSSQNMSSTPIPVAEAVPVTPIAEPTGTFANIGSSIGNAGNSIVNTTGDIASSISDNVSAATEQVSNSLDSFGDASVVDASTSFLNSNTIIAKFAFLLFVLIAFMFLLNLGVMIIGYFTKSSNNPMLVQGTLNGANSLIISQDPKNAESIPILRSNNQSGGIEFTWSVWVFVNDIKTTDGNDFSVIFNKGNGTFFSDGPFKGLSSVTSGPGLYLDNNAKQEGRVNLVVAMNTVSSTNPREMMIIQDIPLRKWFHCAVRLENVTLDAYINGTISNRVVLQDVPKQNYEDVYICANGGFNGNISNLQYYSSALSVFQINNIVVWGRNTSSSDATASDDATGFPYYLSNLWYNANN
jgi:hypothetical protein